MPDSLVHVSEAGCEIADIGEMAAAAAAAAAWSVDSQLMEAEEAALPAHWPVEQVDSLHCQQRWQAEQVRQTWPFATASLDATARRVSNKAVRPSNTSHRLQAPGVQSCPPTMSSQTLRVHLILQNHTWQKAWLGILVAGTSRNPSGGEEL